MTRAKAILKKIRLFFQKHSNYRKVLLMIIAVFAGFVVYFAITGFKLPEKVWLPEGTRYESGEEALFSLPIKSETVLTKYGRALRFTTTTDRSAVYKDLSPWTTIYQLHSNSLLKPSNCPNIGNSETLLPSECDKVGIVQGQPVYFIHRSLPSGATEYYVELEQTFIYIRMGGDGGESLEYLNTFVGLSSSRINPYFADNAKRVDVAKERQRTQEGANN